MRLIKQAHIQNASGNILSMICLYVYSSKLLLKEEVMLFINEMPHISMSKCDNNVHLYRFKNLL